MVMSNKKGKELGGSAHDRAVAKTKTAEKATSDVMPASLASEVGRGGQSEAVHRHSESKKPKGHKPIELWIGLLGVIATVILFLVPKTTVSIVICLSIIFLCAFPLTWDFWWIEEKLWRRIAACLLIALSLGTFGVKIWPSSGLEVSVQQARIDIDKITASEVSDSNAYPHLNVYYRNGGALTAKSLGVMNSLIISGIPIPESQIEQSQDALLGSHNEVVLGRQTWFDNLSSHKNSDLASGNMAWMSISDNGGNNASAIESNIPGAMSRHLPIYVIEIFKYWDDSMPEHVFGVTEHCQYFMDSWDAPHICGRNRTFLEKETFTHTLGST